MFHWFVAGQVQISQSRKWWKILKRNIFRFISFHFNSFHLFNLLLVLIFIVSFHLLFFCFYFDFYNTFLFCLAWTLFRKTLCQNFATLIYYVHTVLCLKIFKSIFVTFYYISNFVYIFTELKGPVGQIYPSDRSVLAVEQNKTLIPPSYSRYLAFGYADLSLRIGSYDTDKASTVFEGTQSGEVKCAVCPNSKLVITGGLSTVSWPLKNSQ